MAADVDAEEQSVVAGEVVVDGEFGGEIPSGVVAGVFVNRGFDSTMFLARVAGDGNDGVYVHFREEVHILEVLSGDNVEL